MASNIFENEELIVLDQIGLPQFNSIECIEELRILLEGWGLTACFSFLYVCSFKKKIIFIIFNKFYI